MAEKSDILNAKGDVQPPAHDTMRSPKLVPERPGTTTGKSI